MRFCIFLHFSTAYAIEKWRHIPVPRESLPFAEIPFPQNPKVFSLHAVKAPERAIH